MKFKFLDRVTVKSGFYEGFSGRVDSVRENGNNWQYCVDLGSKSVWFDEDNLIGSS